MKRYTLIELEFLVEIKKQIIMIEKENIIKKKLSHKINRTGLRDFTCDYQYNFSSNQWLEDVDNYEYFGIPHNEFKQKVIDYLVDEFRISLNNVVFGVPGGIALSSKDKK